MSEYLMNELRHTIEQQGKAIAALEAANAALKSRVQDIEMWRARMDRWKYWKDHYYSDVGR